MSFFSFGLSDGSVRILVSTISGDQSWDYAIAESKVNMNSLFNFACMIEVNPLEIKFC